MTSAESKLWTQIGCIPLLHVLNIMESELDDGEHLTLKIEGIVQSQNVECTKHESAISCS